MLVTINGQSREFTGGSSLQDIAESFRKDNRRIIAELNGEIIKNPRWPDTPIREGDVIELITFVGGG